jgi:hypothetical protein
MAPAKPTDISPDSEKQRPRALDGVMGSDAKDIDVTQIQVEYAINEADPDEEFGGTEERARMEKRLIRKLDIRYVRLPPWGVRVRYS